jgi:hypothetical protein
VSKIEVADRMVNKVSVVLLFPPAGLDPPAMMIRLAIFASLVPLTPRSHLPPRM